MLKVPYEVQLCSLALTWKNRLIWWERWYLEDVYHLRVSSSKVSILCSVDKLLDHLRGMDPFVNMALQFELSSAGSPIFNILRTSRHWWHRNEISDNYRWFYGVSGNPNDILSMTRRFELKKVNDVIGTHSKMWEKLRVFNIEIWLEVQGRFNQDHQDIDNATGEGFKFGSRDLS